jgi:hypothetical protein
MSDPRFPIERAVLVDRFPGIRIGRAAADRRHWLIRPDDLLVFDVERVNLGIVPGEGGEPATLRREGRGEAFLIVTFPPQNLAEVAYYTTTEEFKQTTKPDPPPDGQDVASDTDDPLEDPPIDARIAGWSRLVFRVPDDALPIDWTSQGILTAIRDLELSVAANALPRRSPPWFVRPGLVVANANPLIVASAQILQAASVAGAGEVTTQLEATLVRTIEAVTGGSGGAAGMGLAPSGPSTVRAMARDLRGLRMSAHSLGLGLATAGAKDTISGQLAGGGVIFDPSLLRPVPRKPGDHETALELPWRVILSPSRNAAWFHLADAATSKETDRTELWHTRLGSRENGDIARVDPDRTVRAIWAISPPGVLPVTQPKSPADKVPTADDIDKPFRTSLTDYDRHNVVHLSSDFRLKKADSQQWFEPDPLDVDHLALSSLGGWLDSRGAWEDQPFGLSVEEWRHRATLGRDHYVRVVYAGRLFPLGHRASLVKVTERRFEPTKAGNPAYLRQKMFIVVREPIRTYRQSGWLYDGDDDTRDGERWDLKLPFKTIRITTRVSPLIDKPEDTPVVPSEPKTHRSAFWPYVGRKPFCFGVVATDVEDQSVDLSMPLIFLGQDRTDDDYVDSVVPKLVTESYRTRTWPGTNTLLATVPTGGQSIAFAEADKPDDTTFAAKSLTFDAEVPGEARYNGLLKRQPRFLPVIRTAELDIPALQRIAQTTDAAKLVFDTTYLRDAFSGGNVGQVFLAKDPFAQALGVPFSERSDRSGGFVAPDLSLSGLSRISGPVSGDIETVAGGTMDPTTWFADVLDSAKLFGVLNLGDIITDVGFGDLDKLPRLVGGVFDQVQKLVADLERLRSLAEGMAAAELANVQFLLDQLVDPSTGSIAALFSGGPTATVFSQLELLDDELEQLPAALAASSLTAGPKAVVTEAVSSLRAAIAALGAAPDLLEAFANGDFLPQDLSGRFEWRPVLKKWPDDPDQPPIFIPSGDRNLLLSVEASGDTLTVTCSLDEFDLDLQVLLLKFDRVQFRTRAGHKPEIDVAFDTFAFKGPLEFIETLRQLIPLDGFSDPPDVSVTAEGITAGFTMGLPNIAFGVFSLENLSLGAGFTIPFLGPPMSTWFRFCERENPSRLTVMMFGGGFFFGVTVDAKGLQIAEGAIEFGAAISVNFGVASGSVSAMAGLYFKIEGGDLTLAGYFRLRGEVEALGIVSVSIELYLEMRYESGSGKCVGTATISIEIEVALFSTTIEISCSKKFAGSGPDPTLAQMFDVTPAKTSADWNAYCGAFA